MSIRARLVFGWALVGIPLAYGVYQTLVKTASLFTGWTDRRICRSESVDRRPEADSKPSSAPPSAGNLPRACGM
jgi:hypothetical protein